PPAAAYTSAMRRPMPLAAPVTTQTLPSSRFMEGSGRGDVRIPPARPAPPRAVDSRDVLTRNHTTASSRLLLPATTKTALVRKKTIRIGKLGWYPRQLVRVTLGSGRCRAGARRAHQPSADARSHTWIFRSGR